MGETAVASGITDTGAGSGAVHLAGAAVEGLDDPTINASDGERIRRLS